MVGASMPKSRKRFIWPRQVCRLLQTDPHQRTIQAPTERGSTSVRERVHPGMLSRCRPHHLKEKQSGDAIERVCLDVNTIPCVLHSRHLLLLQALTYVGASLYHLMLPSWNHVSSRRMGGRAAADGGL